MFGWSLDLGLNVIKIFTGSIKEEKMNIVELEKHAKINNWSIVEDSLGLVEQNERIYITPEGRLKSIQYKRTGEVVSIVKIALYRKD